MSQQFALPPKASDLEAFISHELGMSALPQFRTVLSARVLFGVPGYRQGSPPALNDAVSQYTISFFFLLNLIHLCHSASH